MPDERGGRGRNYGVAVVRFLMGACFAGLAIRYYCGIQNVVSDDAIRRIGLNPGLVYAGMVSLCLLAALRAGRRRKA